MTKYRKITDISLVTDTISMYRKNRYLKCRYDTDTDIGNISTIFSIYRPTSNMRSSMEVKIYSSMAVLQVCVTATQHCANVRFTGNGTSTQSSSMCC